MAPEHDSLLSCSVLRSCKSGSDNKKAGPERNNEKPNRIQMVEYIMGGSRVSIHGH